MTSPFPASRSGAHLVRELEAGDGRQVQPLLEADPAYFEAIQGAPPGPAEAQSLFQALPEGAAYDAKVLLGIVEHDAGADGTLVGVVDLIADHPRPGTWTLGTIFVHPTVRRSGVATAAMTAIEAWLVDQGASSIQGRAVDEVTAARPFLERTGFRAERALAPSPRPSTLMVRDLRRSGT